MAKRTRDRRSNVIDPARQQLREYLRQNQLRATRQREVVLEAFLNGRAHVSVDDLYHGIRRRHPSIGHATIYRSMNLFVEAGIAKVRRFDEGRVRFEPAVNVGHHDHLVCLGCGGIQEFEDPTIEKTQEEIAKTRAFQVQYHRLELYGFCAACRTDTG